MKSGLQSMNLKKQNLHKNISLKTSKPDHDNTSIEKKITHKDEMHQGSAVNQIESMYQK